MMYPIFRLVSLAVRLFSRPAIELMKKVHYSQISHTSLFNRVLERLGNIQYRVKIMIDRKLMNIRTDHDMFSLGLQRDIALEKGIHFFYESMFYTAVIGAATYEGYRLLEGNRERNRNNIEKLEKISADLDKLIEAAEELINENEEKQAYLDTNIEQTGSLIESVYHHTEGILHREKKLHEFVEQAALSQQRILNDLKEIEDRKV